MFVEDLTTLRSCVGAVEQEDSTSSVRQRSGEMKFVEAAVVEAAVVVAAVVEAAVVEAAVIEAAVVETAVEISDPNDGADMVAVEVCARQELLLNLDLTAS